MASCCKGSRSSEWFWSLETSFNLPTGTIASPHVEDDDDKDDKDEEKKEEEKKEEASEETRKRKSDLVQFCVKCWF